MSPNATRTTVPGPGEIGAVMYHYVRPASAAHPGLHALHPDDLARQLDHLQATAPMVDRDDLLAAVAHDGPWPEGWILTFDDGLRDHVRHVLPELERRGLWAAFCIPAGPALTGRPLDVHLVHGLLARHGGPVVLAALAHHLDRDRRGAPRGRHRPVGAAAYRDHHEDAASIEVRRSLNYDVDPAERSALLDALDADLGSGVEVEEWYLGGDDLRRLRDAGHLLLAHSVRHRPLAQLSPSEQRDEVDAAFDWLEGEVGPGPRGWCHPYGGPGTFDTATDAALEAAEVRWALTAIEGMVTEELHRRSPWAWPRLDCCRLPSGRSRAGGPTA